MKALKSKLPIRGHLRRQRREPRIDLGKGEQSPGTEGPGPRPAHEGDLEGDGADQLARADRWEGPRSADAEADPTQGGRAEAAERPGPHFRSRELE